MDCANLDRILKLRMKHTHKEYVHSLFVWLVLICSERKVLLVAGFSERKVLLTDG
jgi:hypothetical protein